MRHEPDIAAGLRQRHYGMDWLRIGAFALLILYHIAMVFAPWHWVVKSQTTYPALIAPMALLTPWRLALLFAVSGYASAKLLARSATLKSFVASRNARLLVPLAIAMAVLVPIEMWVRVRAGGYPAGYLHFWAHDYWRSGRFFGIEFPSWEHMWFVAYLWAYTLVLAGVLSLKRSAVPLVAWIGAGPRLLWTPIAALATAKLSLMFVVPERQGLLSDWGGHVEYGAMLAFGFLVARHPVLWHAIHRAARPAMAIAAVAGAIVVAVELSYPGEHVPPHATMALDRIARIAMAWSMTLLLFDLAERLLNRDHRWRGPLARGVFPAYILHHPAIVLTAWWTLPLGLPAAGEFALLVAACGAVCLGGYWLGSRIGWLGAAIGLPPRPAISVPDVRRLG